MLDMNLIQERPALKVDFQHSLAENIFSTLSLVLDASSLEGLDQWAYATHAALPPTLRRDMELALVLLLKSCLYTVWVNRLPADASAHADFDALLVWLNTITEADFQQAIERTLDVVMQHCDLGAAPALDDTDALRTCFGVKFKDEQLDYAIQLAQNPSELKALFISVITRFWEQFYQREYEQCLPLVQRSLEYHRRQNYSADLVTVFTTVTGRRFPKDKDYASYEDMERVIFVPSGHIGPYVMIDSCEEANATVMIHYNCRPTSTPEGEVEVPAIQDTFPPLKALADETRLQILSLLDGKELYAQQIVDQLDISQSAVSRHLHLMVAGGILDMRKQESMKYYSVNANTLVALA